MLHKYAPIEKHLQGLDKAKYLLLVADILKHAGKKADDHLLRKLIEDAGNKGDDWQRIKQKHQEILKQEDSQVN